MRLSLRNRWLRGGGLLLALAVLMAALFADLSTPARAASVSNLGSGNWSDKSIWPGGRLPSAGDAVEIAAGTAVTYDAASATVERLVIKGTLSFARHRDTNLEAGSIYVAAGGLLEIGTADAPIPASARAVISLAGKKDFDSSIAVAGEWQVHGTPLRHVYTSLAADAVPGQSSIIVEAPVDWRPGDHIVITSTTRRPSDTEAHHIKSVSGAKIVLRRPLAHWHSGTGPAKAEVANLTRNVVITSKDMKHRGHTMFMRGAKGSISYAEFAHLGVRDELGKYPIHFHMAGDTMKGSYVRGASIWDSANRFITVHSTQDITLSDNVGFGAIGHGFFMETGDEVHVTWERNLGIGVKPGRLLPSDDRPAAFWIQNPVNTYVDNIAVGSEEGDGFQFVLPHRRMDIPGFGPQTSIRSLAVLRFEGNEAHSNALAGLRTYPLNQDESDTPSLFKGLTLWRNGMAGASLRSNYAVLEDALAFGNGLVDLAIHGQGNVVRASRVVGELASSSGEAGEIAPTPRGITVWGQDNAIEETTLEGHVATPEVTGSDISLDADVLRQDMLKTTLTIRDSVMKSERPIIFGYPLNRESNIRVYGYQRQPGVDFLLFRLDEQPPVPCDYSPDLHFVANRCALEER